MEIGIETKNNELPSTLSFQPVSIHLMESLVAHYQMSWDALLSYFQLQMDINEVWVKFQDIYSKNEYQIFSMPTPLRFVQYSSMNIEDRLHEHLAVTQLTTKSYHAPYEAICRYQMPQGGCVSILQRFSYLPSCTRFHKGYIMKSFQNVTQPLLQINSYLQNMAISKLPCDDFVKLLSKREEEVLILIGEGLSDQEIADKIYLSWETVKHHRKSLLKKLNARNKMELVRIATLNGLGNSY